VTGEFPLSNEAELQQNAPTIVHQNCPVVSTTMVGPGVFVISLRSSNIADVVTPGQFINILVNGTGFPLLRRPFSIHRTSGDIVEILFNIVGPGTEILASKKTGDVLDVIGPLGTPFSTGGAYTTAVCVAGGLGMAPLPILSAALSSAGKNIVTFLGARTSEMLIDRHCVNVHAATDDGSRGFHGTVIEAMRSWLSRQDPVTIRIFGCGPNAMLSALSDLAAEYRVSCQVSLETSMACGVGICQGCPVELAGPDIRYALVCRDGPVFDSTSIRIARGGTH
jgi:dihydroorotate dehydrogenase electron transfer subunit